MSTYARDLTTNNIIFEVSQYPVTKTATATGTGVDMIETDGLVNCTQLNGTTSGTTPTLDGKVQESDDNSTYTDITGATFTQVTAASAKQTITFQRTKRYVRWVGTIAGTSPSFIPSAFFQGTKKISY